MYCQIRLLFRKKHSIYIDHAMEMISEEYDYGNENENENRFFIEARWFRSGLSL